MFTVNLTLWRRCPQFCINFVNGRTYDLYAEEKKKKTNLVFLHRYFVVFFFLLYICKWNTKTPLWLSNLFIKSSTHNQIEKHIECHVRYATNIFYNLMLINVKRNATNDKRREEKNINKYIQYILMLFTIRRSINNEKMCEYNGMLYVQCSYNVRFISYKYN